MSKLTIQVTGTSWNVPGIGSGSSKGPPPKPPRSVVENRGLGYITFVSYDPHFAFTCLLGDGTATPTAGYAGWQVVQRARRRGLVEWPGNDPLEIEIPIMFDAFADDDGLKIESDIRQLEKMAGLSDDLNEPPLLVFNSDGVVPHDNHDASQTDWVIKDIKWGDADRNAYGNRVRQAATVTVIQYIDDDALSNMTASQRRRQQTKAKQKGKATKQAAEPRYVVKGANETLEKIAAKKLGSSKKWRTLRTLNPKITDPRRILPIGTVIKLK